MTKKTTSKKTAAGKSKTSKAVKKSPKAVSAKPAAKKASAKTASPKPKAKAAGKKKGTASSAVRKSSAAKNEQSLSQRDKVILKIKQDLMSQRESLLKEAEETLSSLPTELNFPDMGDQATAETDRNFMLRLRDRERMLLKKIEETIERIDSEHFGICLECGNEIGIKRLEARPVTTLCIDCKTRQEEEERIAEGG